MSEKFVIKCEAPKCNRKWQTSDLTKKGKTISNYVRHFKEKHPNELYVVKCDKCGKEWAMPPSMMGKANSAITYHRANVHKPVPKPEKKKKKTGKITEKGWKYRCRYCDWHHVSESREEAKLALEEHMMSEHEDYHSPIRATRLGKGGPHTGKGISPEHFKKRKSLRTTIGNTPQERRKFKERFILRKMQDKGMTKKKAEQAYQRYAKKAQKELEAIIKRKQKAVIEHNEFLDKLARQKVLSEKRLKKMNKPMATSRVDWSLNRPIGRMWDRFSAQRRKQIAAEAGLNPSAYEDVPWTKIPKGSQIKLDRARSKLAEPSTPSINLSIWWNDLQPTKRKAILVKSGYSKDTKLYKKKWTELSATARSKLSNTQVSGYGAIGGVIVVGALALLGFGIAYGGLKSFKTGGVMAQIVESGYETSKYWDDPSDDYGMELLFK